MRSSLIQHLQLHAPLSKSIAGQSAYCGTIARGQYKGDRKARILHTALG